MGFGAIIFNFIGGTVRWIYGTIWRTIANKPKYKFSEYINGIENSNDIFDKLEQNFANKIIGMLTVVIHCFIVFKL